MEKAYKIKEKDTVIRVGDLIEALKDHKDKELMIHLWVVGKKRGKNKILIDTPEILGGIDGDIFNFTLMVGEWELEEYKD